VFAMGRDYIANETGDVRRAMQEQKLHGDLLVANFRDRFVILVALVVHLQLGSSHPQMVVGNALSRLSLLTHPSVDLLRLGHRLVR
jgi:hypothetical protein